MTDKPFVHRIDTAWMGCNELFNLFLGQVFAMAFVEVGTGH